MLAFVFSAILFITAAARPPLQDASFAPAAQFAGHNEAQGRTAAGDALHRLLNRQLTCDPGYGLCSNGGCCPLADKCCTNSNICVQAGGVCCNDKQHTCPPEWNCCGAYCSPVGGQCCRTGYYCPDGWWCVLYSGQQYCCYGLGCLGTYNPQYQAVPTITGNTLVAPTNAAGSGGASAPAPTGGSEAPSTYPTTTSSSPMTAIVYSDYYFTVTWSYDSYYYTGTAEEDYTWQTEYDSTTVSFYCSDYLDASISAEQYSMTEKFPTPTGAALPSFTNSVAATTATSFGFGANSTTTASSGGTVSSSSGSTAGALVRWQECASIYLAMFIVSCFLLDLVL